jgi:two-component system chemotaxis response regulator CheY
LVKVLVVDDNEDNLLTLELLLEEFENLTIKEAKDGKEAIECFNEEFFDLVFMDILMPNIDGFDATQKIKQNHPKAMIVAISALDDEFSKDRMLLCGAEDYLTKPIEHHLFHQRIKNYLSIIRYRKEGIKQENAINPFQKSVFFKRVAFFINCEAGLAEFWDDALNEGRLTLFSDEVRFVYGVGLWLLKLKKPFKILIEQDEDAFYLTLLNASGIKRSILSNLIKKHLPNILYMFDDNSIYLKLTKNSKESISLDEETRELLGKTHHGSMNAKEYVESSVISLLPKIESLESIEDAIDMNLLELSQTHNLDTILLLADNFKEYHSVLELLTNFNHLAFAIESLIEFLCSIKDKNPSNDKLVELSNMLLDLLHDLTNWREQLFVKQEAVNIHYLDASLLNSCMQIRAVFDDKVIDEGDDLEFF